MTSFAREDWTVWGCDASVVVTSSADLGAATEIAKDVVLSIDDACSRFRNDSELSLIAARLSRGVRVSSTLANLVEGALRAARLTDGDVDPTLGNELAALGYDRDIDSLPSGAELPPASPTINLVRRTRSWPRVSVADGVLTVPPGVRLDLGATAKAIGADLASARIADELGCGALVSLGGDIATAGANPTEGWEVLVQDQPADPSQQVTLAAGAAIATSSTQKRRWVSDGFSRHHILDPRFGVPAEPVWRSVTVASHSCLHANALSTASVVRGFSAVRWLDDLGISARFIDVDGRVVTTSGWPLLLANLTTAGALL